MLESWSRRGRRRNASQATARVPRRTTSIENSERVSRLLKARKVPHQVLNAKHHERVPSWPRPGAGAVTVATNAPAAERTSCLGQPEFLAMESLPTGRPWNGRSREWTRRTFTAYWCAIANLQAGHLARKYLRDRCIAEE